MAIENTTENAKDAPLLLITGCSGLIGSRLAAEFRDDHRLVGLDVRPPDDAAGYEDFIECDLTDDDSVEGAVRQLRERHGERVASVAHLAAYYDFSGEPSRLYHDLTVAGTSRLLQSLRDLDVEQFVFSSTLLVMKDAKPGEEIHEESPVEPEWEYPESKLRTEQLILHEHGEIPAVVLRIAGVYDERCHSVPIAQQMKRIHEKAFESHVFPGNRDHGQPFVHLDDLAALFRRVVDSRDRLEPFETFLVAEPEIVSYGDLQDLIGQELHGKDWLTVRVPSGLAKVGAMVQEETKIGGDPFIKPWMVDLADAHYPVTIAHARDRLGWEPRHRLRDTIPAMARHLKEDPAAWYEANGLEPPEES